MTTSPHAQPLLSIKGLTKHFPLKRSLFGKADVVRAVEQIDFDVLSGETLGVVGESGCGKSVTARAILRILDRNGSITAGTVTLDPGSGKVALRAVKVGEYRENAVTITAGLADGEQVVGAGVHKLVPGQVVRALDVALDARTAPPAATVAR